MRRRLVGLRGLRRRSVALAAVNLAAAAIGVTAEVAPAGGVWARCSGAREKGAVAAAAALAVVRIAVMVGMARAQEVTALAVVASDAHRGGGVTGPTQDFAKRETRVGRRGVPPLASLISLAS
ncbi:hypothetical protein HU200_027706 [Digitaria exilis]|uniref:DUF7358 domain-containing protein n=1 Tax=Digitaria exilis TaxID=1010633 RepID=A0A835BYJ9_9POAL|nr:hypothetical protein HU200_027706 [Digitaria exilis]